MYGNEVPTISNVSHRSKTSCDGRVPRSPSGRPDDRPRGVGAVVRHRLLAEQRLHDGRRQRLRDRLELLGRAGGAAAREDGDLLADVQDLRRLAQVGVGREPGAPGLDLRGVVRDVPLRAALVTGHLLDIHRQGDVTHPAVRQRGATRQVDHVLDARRVHDPRVVLAHVDEESIQLDVLLGVGIDEIRDRQPGDGEDGLPVQLGVVEPLEEVDAPRPRRGETDAQAAGELGVAARHETRPPPRGERERTGSRRAASAGPPSRR